MLTTNGCEALERTALGLTTEWQKCLKCLTKAQNLQHWKGNMFLPPIIVQNLFRESFVAIIYRCPLNTSNSYRFAKRTAIRIHSLSDWARPEHARVERADFGCNFLEICSSKEYDWLTKFVTRTEKTGDYISNVAAATSVTTHLCSNLLKPGVRQHSLRDKPQKQTIAFS